MTLSVDDMLQQAEDHARNGELVLAAEQYRAVLAEHPGHPNAAAGLKSLNLPGPPQADVSSLIELLNDQRYDDALLHSGLLAKQFPGAAVLETVQGAALAGLGRYDAAIAHYLNAIEIDPGTADAYNNLAAALLDLGRYEEAAGTLARALRIKPDFAIAHNNLGNALLHMGRPQEALESLEAALELAPEYAEAHHNLGRALRDLGRYKEAVESFKRALEIEPGFVIAHNNLGKTLREFGKVDEAVTCFENALQLAPRFAAAHNNLGDALSALGQRDEAVASFRKALELNPGFAAAHRNLSLVTHYEPGDAHIAHMLSLVESEDISEADRMQLCFALGKAHEDLGEWDKAFGFYARANRIAKEKSGYALAEDVDAFTQVLSWFPPEVSAIEDSRDDAITPVFIVGMPRSGTTLVEEILASHSEVHAAGELILLERSVRVGSEGELPDPGTQLAAIRDAYHTGLVDIGVTEPYVTDTTPLNFRWIGFICTALPGARIVNVERDPRATCWSIFRHEFAGQAHGFANDLKDLAGFYNLYRAAMAFWRERFPDRIYDLSYESLTENPEDETRRLLEYVGLPFEDACLESLETGQAAQSDSEAWRHYEAHLGPLIEALEAPEG